MQQVCESYEPSYVDATLIHNIFTVLCCFGALYLIVQIKIEHLPAFATRHESFLDYLAIMFSDARLSFVSYTFVHQ